MNGVSPGKYIPNSPICTEPFSSRYTVQEDIGRGKFAVVKKCVNLQTGEQVAAKMIRKRRMGKSCREEILREVVMLELAMAHPRLVSLKEVFETPSELILVTEYCSGGELFDECVINESFKEDDVRRLLAQILEGLAFLHDNNIVHLDLKPQNILLTKPFPDGEVKICDLGFACLTNTGEDIRDIIGTPDYVAPEVLDYEPLNIQTDMWSLGVLTYVMLTAHAPFAGDTQQETFCNITQVNLDFPDDLFGDINPLARDFIRKLLVKRPRDRMTARQCFDHPWLRDLRNTMSINMPVSDHSEELALDMVVPSNWHMSPDRRSSISTSDTSNTERSSKIDGSSIYLTDQVNSRGSISEDKDSISKTLSHIDIDRHSIDRSSTASFETCPESVDAVGQGSETSPPDSVCVTESSSNMLVPSTSASDGETLSAFAAEVVECVTREIQEDPNPDTASGDQLMAGVSIRRYDQKSVSIEGEVNGLSNHFPVGAEDCTISNRSSVEAEANTLSSHSPVEAEMNTLPNCSSFEADVDTVPNHSSVEAEANTPVEAEMNTVPNHSPVEAEMDTVPNHSPVEAELNTNHPRVEAEVNAVCSAVSSVPSSTSSSEAHTPRDNSSRQENSNKRMSMEIPHKKAKCVELGEERCEEADSTDC